MKSILVFDPGESTGWCFQSVNGTVYGGTARKDHLEVAELIRTARPDIVVLERFNLYPQMAKSLSWNSFYPCETIGAIKVVCMELKIPKPSREEVVVFVAKSFLLIAREIAFLNSG